MDFIFNAYLYIFLLSSLLQLRSYIDLDIVFQYEYGLKILLSLCYC